MDHFVKKETIGFFSNMKNSFMGVLFGFLLIIGSIILIWWNEGRSLDRANALKQMQEEIVILKDTKFHPEYNNRAILIHGEVIPKGKIIDSALSVEADVLVLKRVVKMYQWEEKKESVSEKKLGGTTEVTTTYDYKKTWSPRLIDSSSFEHQQDHTNPKIMRYKSKTFFSEAQLGDYHISKELMGYFKANYRLENLNTKKENLKNYTTFLYLGQDPNNPKIGDIKIEYFYAPSGIYTIAGSQEGRELTYFTPENGDLLFFVKNGAVSSKSIFKEAFKTNSLLTWVLRFAGLVLMYIGFFLIMRPLSAFANLVPVFGTIVSGTAGIVSFILTLILGTIIITLAWFATRPLLSLILIGIVLVIVYFLSKRVKKKQRVVVPPKRKR